MSSAIYEIYKECFSEYPVSFELFNDLLQPDKAHIIYESYGKTIVGYSMIHKNSIAILCVKPEYRNKGYGTKLLCRSEDYIRSNLYTHVRLGRGEYYLLQGVPANESSSVNFLKKRGYIAKSTSVNMILDVKDDYEVTINLPKCPPSIRFSIMENSEINHLLKSVMEVDESWVSIFRENNDPVMIAESDHRIIGFQILSKDGGRFKRDGEQIDSISCVGVIQSARHLGIGRQMVLQGIEYLRGNGCNKIELIYVELVEWYMKLGFRVAHTQWMGEREI